MAGKKIRLFKIASEINIGREAIVEYLNSKGFEIENRATSSLDPEMVEVIYDKFKKEKRAAEVQREKVQKHKDIRKKNVERQKEQEAEKHDEASEQEIAKQEAEIKREIEESKAKAQGSSSKEEIIDNDFEDDDDELSEEEAAALLGLSLKSKNKEETVKEETAETVQESNETQDSNQTDSEDAEVSEEQKEAQLKKAKKQEKDRKEKEKLEKRTGIIMQEPGTAPKLRGLNIQGKIEITPESKPDKKKRKPKSGRAGERPNQNRRDGGQARGQNRGRQTADGQQNQANDQRTGDRDQVQESPKKFKKRKQPGEVVNVDSELNKKGDSGKGKKRRKRSIRDQIKDEDVNKAIKKTLAGMADAGKGSSRQKIRAEKKKEREEKEQIQQEEREKQSRVLELTEFVTTSDLAKIMEVSSNEVIMKCMQLGLMVTINQRLDKETILLIADDYGFDVEFQDEQDSTVLEDEEDAEETLKPRSPIVTIMGHVDHGKTSLLDYIRESRVVAGESGGITQHIGAYRVKHDTGGHITFLDTPGHEAFTAMRARGAQITDIVVIVVAADDDVMPQTKEAISHAQAANVPIVVAINKIDKPEANPDRIKTQLSDEGILVEEWGGKYQSTEISAKQGTNIDKLLDAILLEAEMLELKANPDRAARGTVVEAHMDKGLGAVSTVVIQKGTLKVGDIFVAGTAAGRVRAIFDERDHRLDEAIPSQPVRIIGFDNVPSAGDNFVIVQDESEAKRVANERAKLKREHELRLIRHVTLDDISKDIAVGGVSNLNIILKADVTGSLEALADELAKLSHDEVKISILHKGVGNINESDVQLATASDAIILGFHTSTAGNAKKLADKEGIEIRTYEIIYEVIDDVRNALEGMLRPEISQEVTGEAEVRAIFKLGRVQKIAGCKIISGKVFRNAPIKILRDGLPIFEGKIGSLKREKDDAKEVSEGYECGIIIDNFNDFEEEDIIQAYKIVETKRTFSN
jgi:translation initiation factor IF-2